MPTFYICVECNTVDSYVINPSQRKTEVPKCTCCLGEPWHNEFDKEVYSADKHFSLFPIDVTPGTPTAK